MSIQESDAAKVFLDAVENSEPGRRSQFVIDACGENPLLRARVFELLGALEEPNSLLDGGGAIATLELAPLEPPGTVIGPYTLLEQIGEGGFGVVFLAEQATPIRRRVALKIVKPGMDTRQVLARFEAERQALAMMDHPGIAKVFDAGVTDQGRSYFVMELVQGIPINEYCDECQLPTRERLSLFIAVCQAVQHAHQKGIIHRDLKPTNVLVAMQDGRPVPKIIDFGIAKATEQRLTERTLTTAFAQMVGTPLYMSPEQAELSPLGVDTRTDIYSLGVLLYELLTGTTPFDKDRLHAASYEILRRIIREEEPPRPSSRLTTLAAHQATTIAEHRRTDARRLHQQVRGELDWIVMQCLEKDRNRRYDSVSGLAEDIERFLHHEPVLACPPSVSYRLRKLAQRNKTLLASAVGIAATLLLGLGLATWLYLQAATERARGEAVSDFLQLVLSSSNDGEVESVVEGLARGIDVYDERTAEFKGQPEEEAELATSYAWLANFLETKGRREEAQAVANKAAEHFAHAARRGLPPTARLKALWHLAVARLRLRDEAGYDEASVAMLDIPTENDDDRVLQLSIWCLGPHPGRDLSDQLSQAEELAACNAAKNYVGSHSARWIDLGLMGGLLFRMGKCQQAAERLEESLAEYPRDALVDYRTALDRQLLLAMAKWQLGERNEAQQLLSESQTAVDEWLQNPSNTWMRRAEIELLRREAEAMIEPAQKSLRPRIARPHS